MGIKSVLKNNKVVMALYKKMLPYYCIHFTKPAVKMLYKQTFQKTLDLDHPRDLNEKINWLKVYKYKNNPMVIKCADKWRVREYIKDCGYEDILIPLIGVYNTVDEIDWDSLPQKFVLKFNRGAGMNIVCTDKSKMDRNEVLKQAASWFHAECGERHGELHYRKAKPKLICEEFLDDGSGTLPVDYKVHCFNGNACVTLVCTERAESLKLVFVDRQYRQLDINTDIHSGGVLPEKPVYFDKMLTISEELSKGFPLVRIDFYCVRNRIYIGEMTFTPQGGYIDYISQKGLNWLGDILKLPEG